MSLGYLEKKGACLCKLYVDDHGVGLYGRTVLELCTTRVSAKAPCTRLKEGRDSGF